MITATTAINNYQEIKKHAPLIHNITNFVVMNNTANALLSIGASPVMAHAPEEMKEMVSIASALVINIGTLSESWADAMLIAGKQAKKCGIPIILDPVGAGATSYRTKICKLIISECQPTVIRGNASEIMTLSDSQYNQTKGVDSILDSSSALDCGIALAKQTNAIVCISGKEDFITDGNTYDSIKNHIPIMPLVTGMGCTATAIVGATTAVNDDTMNAVSNAMAIMAVAGEKAMSQTKSPGSFQVAFLDALYQLTENDFMTHLKL